MSPDFTAHAARAMPLAEINQRNAYHRNSFIGTSALAKQLGTSTRTLRRRQAAGLMPPLRRRGHSVGYHDGDIQDWLPTSGFTRSVPDHRESER